MFRAFVVVCPLLAVSGFASLAHAGLVAHYTFDDVDVEGDSIMDVSGNGLHGTKMNAGPMTGVPGWIGQAASFDGGSNNEDNHFVDLSEHADKFGELGEGTLAAWVKPVTTEEAGGADGHLTDVLTIFAASDSTQGSAEMRWVVHTATSPFSPGGPGGAVAHGSQYLGTRGADFPNHLISDVADDVSLLDGDWHHVAVTVDGDNLGTMYIDGTQVDSYYQSGDEIISFMGDIAPDGPDTVGIGRNKDSSAGGGQWFYHGLIDDLRVYDEALSAEDIASIVSPPGTLGDFNADGVLDIGDMDLLTPAISNDTGNLEYDVNGDDVLDGADLNFWVKELRNTWIGDANLDGEFNSADLVAVFTAGKYELDGPPDVLWGMGDWNADGRFGSGDLVAAFTDGGYEQGPAVGQLAVPEPAGVGMLIVGLAVIVIRRRRGSR